MARRLFVDCDDTLILYKPDVHHPDGFADPRTYTLNKPLINFVVAYTKANPGQTIIWSTRGEDYARTVAAHLFPGLRLLATGKTTAVMKSVRPADIVFDNDKELNIVAPIRDPSSTKVKEQVVMVEKSPYRSVRGGEIGIVMRRKKVGTSAETWLIEFEDGESWHFFPRELAPIK